MDRTLARRTPRAFRAWMLVACLAAATQVARADDVEPFGVRIAFVRAHPAALAPAPAP